MRLPDGTGLALAALFHRTGRFHVVAFAQQGQFVQGAQVGFVIDDQQAVLGGFRHRSGFSIRT